MPPFGRLDSAVQVLRLAEQLEVHHHGMVQPREPAP